jgi:hypothetical protein
MAESHCGLFATYLEEFQQSRDGSPSAAGRSREAFARAAQALADLDKRQAGPSLFRRLAYPLLVLLPCVLLLGMYVADKLQAKDQQAYAMLKQRATDLANIKNAVESYKNDHGAYPASEGFEGLYDRTGAMRKDWIRGLVPDYLPRLPRDPRQDNDPSHQYLYNSSGADYKIIAHHPDDCELASRIIPVMIDPLRGCLAYGWWSKGAGNW